jgi:hypothetical protein
MQNEFLPYDRALKLKELGFDEKCFCNWEESWSPEPEDEIRMVLTTDQTWLRPGWIVAPLFQQAFRWFREEHGLGHMINGIGYESFLFNIGGLVTVFPMFKTYEEAELARLDKLIEIVELKNKDNEL